VDDPNYKYCTPPFNYHANDAWFKTLAALFPADKALFDRIDIKRRRLQEEARDTAQAMSMLSSSSLTLKTTPAPTSMQTLDKGTDFGDNLDLDTSLGDAFAVKDELETLDDGDPFLPEPVLAMDVSPLSFA
jgi:predicted component of type VI protein secretion system